MHLQCTFSLCRTYESKGSWHFSLILKRYLSNKKIQYLYCTVSCTVSRNDRTIKSTLFHQSAAWTMKKSVTVTHFTIKIIHTYLYITCTKKILFVKKYLSLLWVFTDFSILLLAFCFKHCDNMATNWNSKNARSSMVASLQGSMGTGTKGDEWSTGCIRAAGFHRVMACSRLARIIKLMNHFQYLLRPTNCTYLSNH